MLTVVVAPETVKFPEITTLASKVAASSTDKVPRILVKTPGAAKEDAPATSNSPLRSAFPVTSIVEAKVAADATAKVD